MIGTIVCFNISNPLNIYSIMKYMKKKLLVKHLEITDVDIEKT